MFPCKAEWLRHFILNVPLDSCFRFYMLVHEDSNRLWHRLFTKYGEWPWRQSIMFWLKICRTSESVQCYYLTISLRYTLGSSIKSNQIRKDEIALINAEVRYNGPIPNTSQQPAMYLQKLVVSSERENYVRECPFFSRQWGLPTRPTTIFFSLQTASSIHVEEFIWGIQFIQVSKYQPESWNEKNFQIFHPHFHTWIFFFILFISNPTKSFDSPFLFFKTPSPFMSLKIHGHQLLEILPSKYCLLLSLLLISLWSLNSSACLMAIDS